jgi:hypothetical protein
MEEMEVSAFEGAPPPFELLVQENGFRFWTASNLAMSLGYEDASKLAKAINRALAQIQFVLRKGRLKEGHRTLKGLPRWCKAFTRLVFFSQRLRQRLGYGCIR